MRENTTNNESEPAVTNKNRDTFHLADPSINCFVEWEDPDGAVIKHKVIGWLFETENKTASPLIASCGGLELPQGVYELECPE